jgi:hypothetical protein
MQESYSKEQFDKAVLLAYHMGIDTGSNSNDSTEHDTKFKRDKEIILLFILSTLEDGN